MTAEMQLPVPQSCSIVIRANNEERHIGRLLQGIAGQTIPGIEIILVDSGSTDRTVEIAKRFGETFIQGGRSLLQEAPLPVAERMKRVKDPAFRAQPWDQHFTAGELQRLHRLAYRLFYGRPRFLARNLLQVLRAGGIHQGQFGQGAHLLGGRV